MNGGVAVLVAFAVLFPAIFLLVGGFLVRTGLRTRRQTEVFERVAARVPGNCVDVVLRSESSASGELNSFWHPVLAFATLDGRQMTVESPWGSTPAPARRGQPVIVLYDPADPRRARVDGALGRGTFFSVAVVVAGSIGLLVGAAIVAVELAVVLS